MPRSPRTTLPLLRMKTFCVLISRCRIRFKCMKCTPSATWTNQVITLLSGNSRPCASESRYHTHCGLRSGTVIIMVFKKRGDLPCWDEAVAGRYTQPVEPYKNSTYIHTPADIVRLLPRSHGIRILRVQTRGRCGQVLPELPSPLPYTWISEADSFWIRPSSPSCMYPQVGSGRATCCSIWSSILALLPFSSALKGWCTNISTRNE